MSNKYVEKVFLIFVAVSLLLHAAGFTLIYFLPQKSPQVKHEPMMVELSDLPEIKGATIDSKREVKEIAEQRRRFSKQVAPKGEREQNKFTSIPRIAPSSARPSMSQQPQNDGKSGMPVENGKDISARELKQSEGIFKQKEQSRIDIARLFPSSRSMAQIEESYRKKYKDVAVGDTKFIDTDDDIIAPFARRLKDATEEKWTRLARRVFTEKGVVLYMIVFKKDGTRENIKLLESSGNKLLEEVALKSIQTADYVGPLPSRWPYDKLHVLYVFSVY